MKVRVMAKTRARAKYPLDLVQSYFVLVYCKGWKKLWSAQDINPTKTSNRGRWWLFLLTEISIS